MKCSGSLGLFYCAQSKTEQQLLRCNGTQWSGTWRELSFFMCDWLPSLDTHPVLSNNLARTPRVSLETCVPGNVLTNTPERQGFYHNSSLSIKASRDMDMAFVSYQHSARTRTEKRRWVLLVDLVTELLVILEGFMLITFLSCIS